MKLRSILGPMVVAWLVALGAATPVLAQVEWTIQGMCVEPGAPGEWDAAGHTVGDVVFDGALYHMYLIGGTEGNAIDDPWRVGHWVSVDRQSWIADPDNPVLEPEPGQWDGHSIIGLAVHYDGATFHMWYGASETDLGPVRGGYATNADGWGAWDKHLGNPLDGLGPGDPGPWNSRGPTPTTVLADGPTYSMWHIAAEGDIWGAWRIGYASSPDGLDWTSHHPDPVLEGSLDWEGIRVYNPEVIPYGGGYAMWYAGLIPGPLAQIGFAVSPDGIGWGRYPGNPVMSPTPQCYAVNSIAVIIEDDTTHAWIDHCGVVWYLTSPLEVVFFDHFETGAADIWSSVVE